MRASRLLTHSTTPRARTERTRTAAIIVSGLWGLFYYKEAPRGAMMWSLGALTCTGGIVLLATLAS